MLTYIREKARRDFTEAMFESCADNAIASIALCETSLSVPCKDATITRKDGRVYHAGQLFAPTLDSALTIALACLEVDGCVSVAL
jgi:hypothetical protein